MMAACRSLTLPGDLLACQWLQLGRWIAQQLAGLEHTSPACNGDGHGGHGLRAVLVAKAAARS